MNIPLPREEELYYHGPSARSPTSQRNQSQNLQRESSRHFESYGNISSSDMFPVQDPNFRYEPTRFDRMNGQMPSAYGFDMSQAAQSWNPNAFSANNQIQNAGYAATTRGFKAPMRGRPGLPQTWMDPSQMAQMGGFNLNGSSHLGVHSNHHKISGPHDQEDELIPTAIVIKNIPFNVRKEAILETMTSMNLPLPYAFNYHFDQGVFRGLAFANFTSAEETQLVIEMLNHHDVEGRRLRVEYKKMLPLQERERIEREKRERRGQLEEQHRPLPGTSLQNHPSMSSMTSRPANTPSPIGNNYEMPNLNDPEVLHFYNQLMLFREDPSREALIFPSHLSPTERRTVHFLAHSMKLCHQSRGLGEQRQIHVYRTERPSPPLNNMQSIHANDRIRNLNRAATIDFNDAKSADPSGNFNILRGQQSSGLLGIPDSPGSFGANQNLRAAKSVADLRSYSPSPSPSNSTFQQHLGSQYQSQNYPRVAGTPSITTGPFGRGDDDLVNGFGNMALNRGNGVTADSPRNLRSKFSWDHEKQSSTNGPVHAGAIGSNRSVSVSNNYDNASSRDRGIPVRQPHGPSERGASAFSRGRQTSHQQRGSDEMRQQSNVDIIVEEGHSNDRLGHDMRQH